MNRRRSFPTRNMRPTAVRPIRQCAARRRRAKRYRYTGKERDEESGLYYHGARYYASWIGRWTSSDPAGDVDGPNGYVYVRCKPARLTDPNGLYGWGDFWDDVGAGVVGAVKGIAEPALVVMDFGQMGAALVTHAITGDPDDLNVDFLSATGKRIAASDDPTATGWRAGLVLATAIPTGGGSVLVDNVATAIATGDPDQARHILVQGAVGQVAATGIAVGVSSATGNGPTGRGTSAGDAALVQRIVDARVSEGATETGRGNPSGRTFGTGRTGQGDLTPVRQSHPGGGDPHADPQVLTDVGSRGGRTVALDQAPCPTCRATLGAPPEGQPSMFRSSLEGSLRVITPERANSPGSSPKAATIRAARAQQAGDPAIPLNPRLQFVVPYAPPITPFQPLPSALSPSSSGPIDLGTGALFLNQGSSTFVPDERLIPAPTIGVGVRF